MLVTTKELRLKTLQILKKVQELGTVTVTLRGKPVAKITALGKTQPARLNDHPAFGMWAGREDMKDVHGWLRKIRAPRYDRLGRRRPRP